MNHLSLEQKILKIGLEYPLIPHVNASRLFSTVRRMKVEKENDIPVNRRAGFIISVKNGKRASEMLTEEWEQFYDTLRGRLKCDYPELYQRIFDSKI